MTLSTKTARTLQVALTVGAVASSLGATIGTASRALAGPTLSNLLNLTNTASVTANNSFGQSFSLEGIVGVTAGSTIKPFAASTTAALMSTAPLVVDAAGLVMNKLVGLTTQMTKTIGRFTATVVIAGDRILGGISGITLKTTSGVQTIGAGITNTVFGPSQVQASQSFTTQSSTSLTAF